MKMFQWVIRAYFLLATSSLYAAGGSGETHLSDLMWPAINFLILAGFLVFKLKNPVKEMFDKNALLVKETYDFAEGKNKEAEIKLKMYREKLQNFNAEERKAKSDGEKEVKTFRERRTKETEGLLKRLERDAASKIKHEKRILIDELNHAFLDAVINQARSTISNNEDSQKKATKNLLSEI